MNYLDKYIDSELLDDVNGFLSSADSIIALLLITLSFSSLYFFYNIDMDSSLYNSKEYISSNDLMEALSSPYNEYYNDISYLNNYESSIISSNSVLDIIAIELKKQGYPENELSTQSKAKIQSLVDNRLKNIIYNKNYILYETSTNKEIILARNINQEFHGDVSSSKKIVGNYTFILVLED